MPANDPPLDYCPQCEPWMAGNECPTCHGSGRSESPIVAELLPYARRDRIEPPSDCVCPRCDHAVAGAQPGQRIDCWYCRHVYRAPAIGPPFDSRSNRCPTCGTPYVAQRKWNSGSPMVLMLPDCECPIEPPFDRAEPDWEAEAEGTAVERMQRLREAADGPPSISDEDDWGIAPLPPRKRYHVVLRPPRDDYAWDASAGWWVLDVG